MECLFLDVQQTFAINMSFDEKARLFRADAVWFPVLDEAKLRDVLNHGWSDKEVGNAMRWLIMPRHAACVPDKDLWATPPKFTTWHGKLGPYAPADTYV